VYDRIQYQVKYRAGNRGITVENVEKSQRTDFNEHKTNESASVTTVKVGHSGRMKKHERTEKDSACFVDSKENK